MKLNEMVALEASYQESLSDIKRRITEDIRKAEIPNVAKLGTNCCTVKLSNLSVWDPNYYISDAQANAVEKVINGKGSGTALVNSILEMIETGYAGSSKNRVPLNKTTITVLKTAIEQ